MRTHFIKILAVVLSCLLLAGCTFGSEAVSIIDANINDKGELILYYSDGTKDNLGVVVGKDGLNGEDGEDGQGGPGGNINVVTDVAAATAVGLRSSVSIFCTYYEKGSWGASEPYYTAGSGVIYQLDKKTGSAFIITNYHVVYDLDSRKSNGIAEEIDVYLYGGEIQGAEMKATYVGGSQNYDIAILRIDGSDVLKSSDALAVTVADSNQVRVGSTAIAIGNPEGEGISASCGVVSVDTEHIVMTGADGVTEVDFRVMRFDTPVNHGNSGGGLFDAQGRLIGIVNAKTIDDEVENIGYALPTSTVTAVADNIIDYCYNTSCESVQRPILGVTVVTKESKGVYDPETGNMEIVERVEILEVSAGQIGSVFKTGDVLLRCTLRGQTVEITRQHHMIDLMITARVGDVVEVTVLRDGKEVTLSLGITQGCLTAY